MQEKLKSNAGHHPGTWPWKKGSSKARSLKTQVDAPVKSMRLGRAKDLCGTAGDGGAIVKVANESRETRTQPRPELWGPDLTGAADRVRLVTWRAASSPPASTGMWRLFFQPFQTGNLCNGKSQATAMAQEPAQWHRPLLASINHRPKARLSGMSRSQVEKSKSQTHKASEDQAPLTRGPQTTTSTRHGTMLALGTRPIVAARPAATGSPPGEPGLRDSIGQRGETCSGRIGLLGALFSNVTRGWCEDIATLPQQVCAGPEHAGPAKQSIVSSGTMPRMPCPDARCWRVPSKLVEAPVVVLFR